MEKQLETKKPQRHATCQFIKDYVLRVSFARIMSVLKKVKPMKPATHFTGQFSRDLVLAGTQLECFAGQCSKDFVLRKQQLELRKSTHPAAVLFSDKPTDLTRDMLRTIQVASPMPAPVPGQLSKGLVVS